MPSGKSRPRESKMNDFSEVEKHFRLLMEEGLGLDLSNPNLVGTPERVARMYQELFSGLDTEFEGVTSFPNDHNYDEIVLLDNIFFVSVCSHHFLPFYGKAWVAYIPSNKVMGASKASRVINHYSARPQLQENLSHEIVNFLERKLNPKALMVVMRAEHGCMKCRGVKQYDGAGMLTSAVKGSFKTDSIAKSEALDLIKLSVII